MPFSFTSITDLGGPGRSATQFIAKLIAKMTGGKVRLHETCSNSSTSSPRGPLPFSRPYQSQPIPTAEPLDRQQSKSAARGGRTELVQKRMDWSVSSKNGARVARKQFSGDGVAKLPPVLLSDVPLMMPSPNKHAPATELEALRTQGEHAKGFCRRGAWGAGTCRRSSDELLAHVPMRIMKLPRERSKELDPDAPYNRVTDFRRKLAAGTTGSGIRKRATQPPISQRARNTLYLIKVAQAEHFGPESQPETTLTPEEERRAAEAQREENWRKVNSIPMPCPFRTIKISKPADRSDWRANLARFKALQQARFEKDSASSSGCKIAILRRDPPGLPNIWPTSEERIKTADGGYKRKRELRIDFGGVPTVEPSPLEEFVEGAECSPALRKKVRLTRPKLVASSEESDNADRLNNSQQDQEDKRTDAGDTGTKLAHQ